MKTDELSSFDRGFIINWILLSVIGLVLGTTAHRFVFSLIFSLVGGGLLGKAIEGAVIGGAIGVVQMLSLPALLKPGWGWAAGSAMGWGIGWSLGWSYGWQLLGGFSLVYAAIGLFAGGLSGLLQWPLLRGHLSWSFMWIVASAVGWGIGLAVGMFVRGGFGWPLAAAISSALTGAVLYWLLSLT